MVFAVPLSSAPKGADLLDRYPSINKSVPFFVAFFAKNITATDKDAVRVNLLPTE